MYSCFKIYWTGRRVAYLVALNLKVTQTYSPLLTAREYDHLSKTKYTFWANLTFFSEMLVIHVLYQTIIENILGAVSIRKTVLPGMAIPMLKIRRPNGRLIFNMEIAIRK